MPTSHAAQTSTATAPATPTRHPHDDAPATAAQFARLVTLPEGEERQALIARLVESWLPMAHRIAGRFRNKGESLEDLQQIAAMGLLKAVRRYQPDRGAFESYAVPTITGELRRHFRDRMWDVRVPRRVQELRNKVRVARRDLMNGPEVQGEPSLAALAERTRLSTDQVREGLEALESYSALSLDTQFDANGDGFSLTDTLGAQDPAYDIVVDREAVKAGLRELPERERAILYLRFFEDMTQSRIAERFKISQMHVSRLIARSCARVRDRVEAA
ncbi:SigB/SigF/SigG family RNA polymerase sigma factor [Streptomyces sp. VRA16 Mangrove soil]|uniref:SigB/SigF/SigG family RNA polymerase sigma factor n=1 Tax=Streptomyces sp. VRA16 Mangrove soil TaxID=2817434 RepID=UPI001A9DA942|nr:SigB/SigF/SigG family RNA polymerase sigma factor [Streptomyces sp. VRA16 Mangrove soil]MBO1330380.1 SigB/SigF/SigG family RNA polymerase sigma factor [Streptomyces sp. VRA16 Mangrove soil]